VTPLAAVSTATSGKHVSHPVSTGAVGQRNHIVAIAAEHIDGCFVNATAPPATVNGDSKSWKVTGKRRQHFNEKELVDLTLAVIAINGRKQLGDSVQGTGR
jgi:hypothetical protein